MSWNYRIIRHVNDDDEFFQIHEVYYTDGSAVSVSEEPIPVHGDTLKELGENLKMQKRALTKPVLDYSQFERK